MNLEHMAKRLERAVKKAMKHPAPERQEIPHLSTSIKFTEAETAKMSEEDTFKREFEQNARVARVIKYPFGYEIRYIRNGFHRYAFNADLASAKRELIEGATE